MYQFKNYVLVLLLIGCQRLYAQKDQKMDEMWGNQDKIGNIDMSSKTNLFDDGNYSMFIHWGIYSNIANKWKDTTYYGISEWIKHPRRANISDEEYMAEAKNFNPVNFDAKSIAKLPKMQE
jgi:alpha-L-fucosidase